MMLKEKIEKLMHQALKEQDKERLNVLRFVLSQINYAQIEKHEALTDNEILEVLKKEAKKRKEALVLIRKSHREDLIKSEEVQIKIIEEFLPKPMGEVEIEKIIDEVIKVHPDKIGANPGQIIGMVLKKTGSNADGSLVASLVQQKLKGN